MPKVKCKVCEKVWDDISGYKADKGCQSETCPHASRHVREGATKAAKSNIQHVTQGPVTSTYDATKECRYLEVPKVIAVHIFPRKGK